jgi:hypothetical protein
VTLPAGGHMVPITHPHELVAAVAPFLGGSPIRGGSRRAPAPRRPGSGCAGARRSRS